MKRQVGFALFACLLLLAASAVAYAGTPLTIVKGPYLQNVTTGSMVVMWETSEASDSRVDFGLTAEYTHSVYDATETEIHEVILCGLATDTRYHYQVTSGTVSSEDNSLETAVTTGTAFRFVAYGDTRSQPREHAAVIDAIIASGPRIVLHTGDFVDRGSRYRLWEQEFFGPAAPLLKNVALFPSLGNHEENSHWYYDLFDTPEGGGDHNERWYSFDYGNCHFTVLCSETSYAPGSDQYAWLVSDLQSASNEWLFVVLHRPPYSSGAHGGIESPNLETHLVPLFEQYGVDMVFAGHDHHYERSYKNGVYYIVAGGGGAPLRSVNQTPNPYQQYAEMTHHHCTIDIDGTSAIMAARYNDGTIFDSVVMTHGPSPPDANSAGSPTS